MQLTSSGSCEVIFFLSSNSNLILMIYNWYLTVECETSKKIVSVLLELKVAQNSFQHLKLGVFLASHIVAMVTCYIRRLYDIIIVPSLVKQW